MILICEPNCVGFEHAEVNAAFIMIIAKASQGEDVLFAAEETHLVNVIELLKDKSVSLMTLPIKIPRRNMPDVFRFLGDYSTLKNIFQVAIKNKIQKIYFCSILSPSLISLKIMMRYYKGISVFTVIHSPLGTINIFPRRWYLLFPLLFWFRYAFLIGNHKRLKYIVLGKYIEENIKAEFPAVAAHIASIDLPYIFKQPKWHDRQGSKVVSFASFGVGGKMKRTDLLFKLAEDISKMKTKHAPEFIMMGHFVDGSIKEMNSRYVLNLSPSQPLTRKEYDILADRCDYAIYFHDPQYYSFVTSGALFDAFSYVKPVIALKSPLFDHYFKLMGDIGYLCEGYEEMERAIIDILNNDHSDRYRRQQQNILNGRNKISLISLAERLKKILAGY